MDTLKRFSIYHPQNGVVNEACETRKVDYEYITSVNAQNVVRSFYLAQSKLNPEYASLGKRDTTVGDVIYVDENVFMVLKGGLFKRVPKTKELHRKIMETDEAIIEILSRQHLSEDDIQGLIDNCY